MARETEHLQQLYKQLYVVIRNIPRGRVATYGQVAELAGIPGGARIAAASLKVSQPKDRLPWQRVIGKAGKGRGRIAIHDPIGAAIQRRLLEEEGVRIKEDTGLVSLDEFGWLVIEEPSPARAARLRTAGKPLTIAARDAPRRRALPKRKRATNRRPVRRS